MKQLITEEINKIKNLEERVVFKELLNGIFMSLHENNEAMYQQLEDKIFHEVPYESSQFSLFSSLIEKKYFDASHSVFFPMLQRDMEPIEYDLNEIMGDKEDKSPSKVMQVFLECDYLVFKQVLKPDFHFQGYIKTAEDTYRAEFSLSHNLDYIEAVHHLYQVFINNGIPWKTANIPYAFKMVDIILVGCETNIDQKSIIKEIRVEFGEFSKYVRYEVIPVWNVRKEHVGSVGFAMPCEDHRNFDHIVSIGNQYLQGVCLIENKECNIQYIRTQEDKLIVTCDTDDVLEWDIFQICNGNMSKTDYFSYPVLSNQTKNTFVQKLYEKNRVIVRTKGELVRFMESFGLGEYLEFEDYNILDADCTILTETYSLNPFIMDEIRHNNAKKRLILEMRPMKNDHFLTRDFLSFLVSEVQLLLPEYYCEGKLV